MCGFGMSTTRPLWLLCAVPSHLTPAREVSLAALHCMTLLMPQRLRRATPQQCRTAIPGTPRKRQFGG